MHVGDVKGIAVKRVDCRSFLHTGVLHKHSPGLVLTHQYVHIGIIIPIDAWMPAGKDDDAPCCSVLCEAYRSVLGAVAWVVLTRAELAAFVQVLRRRAHAFMIRDCQRLDAGIRQMKTHNCGLEPVTLQHPVELVGFTDATFKATPKEFTGFALRGGLRYPGGMARRTRSP